MTARDERIHALRAQGLTVRQIAAAVGLSHARVVQVLGRERRTLDEIEAGLRGELAELIAERERNRRRIAALRIALRARARGGFESEAMILDSDFADALVDRERINISLARIRRALARIESEREVAAIDRMLGLA